MAMSQPIPRALLAPLGGSPGPPSAEVLPRQQLLSQDHSTSSSTFGGVAEMVSSSSPVSRCPPGWTRSTGPQGQVVYRTALGHEIHNAKQLRDFLLSDVTCKCGLPCPLVIENWFDFSSSNGLIGSGTHAAIEESVTSSNRSLNAGLAPQPRDGSSDENRRQLDRRKAATAGVFVGSSGQSSVAASTGPIRKKASGRRGPYDGLLVSQLLAQQKQANASISCSNNNNNTNNNNNNPTILSEKDMSGGNVRGDCDTVVVKQDFVAADAADRIQGQSFLSVPVMPENIQLGQSASVVTSVVTEESSKCSTQCLTVRAALPEDVDRAGVGLIEEINTMTSPPFHVQTDGTVDGTLVLSSETARDSQGHGVQHQQQPLLVATMDATQIYQQPLQVYCSSATGPGHAGPGILLSPQQSAELVLQNNINNINNMNSLAAAAAAANITNLSGSTMNGIVNSMVQHHANPTVNHLGGHLNAAVSNISSAQVLLSPQLLTYSSVLNPLPMQACPAGVSPITVLGMSSAMPPISIVGVGPPQQLPLQQMSQQMHGTLQLQNHQLLNPPQAAGQSGQTQVTTGGAIVMTTGPYCGAAVGAVGPVGPTAVNTVTLDAAAAVNQLTGGTQLSQHAPTATTGAPQQSQQQQQPQANGGPLCSMTLPMPNDASRMAGGENNAACGPSTGPPCATVQLYNVTALADGGMGTVLLQTGPAPQASPPVTASSCSSVE